VIVRWLLGTNTWTMGLTLWQKGKVGGEKLDIGDALFDSLMAAEEYNGAARMDPFLNVARRECNKLGDWSVEDVKIGCKDHRVSS
jgi:hypothetical protein